MEIKAESWVPLRVRVTVKVNVKGKVLSPLSPTRPLI